jgi:nucleotide-binding universal stress UspA family protein
MTTVTAGRRVALKNIMFATDFSPFSNAALPYVLSIAREYEGKVFAVHVMPSDSYVFITPETWPEFARAEEERAQAERERMEQRLKEVSHAILMRFGEVWDVLSRLIQENHIDLLVVGTHGRTGLKKFLMGSIAEKIFRHASCPVLTVGPNVAVDPDHQAEFKEILFATDFGTASLSALPYAISMAQENQARLSLLTVLERPEAGTVDMQANSEFLLHRLKDLIPPESEFWCTPECFVEFGTPAERILDFADTRHSDLIVLGVHPDRGKLAPTTHLATTAQSIVAASRCPVLTVRG